MVRKTVHRRHAPNIYLRRIKTTWGAAPHVTINTLRCRMPQYVVQHSPDGYEWGYGGSGPADLALNVLHRCLPPWCDGCEPVDLFRGNCSEVAFQLHQAFKREMIAGRDPAGDDLLGSDVDQWIDDALGELSAEGYFAADDGPIYPCYAETD